MKFIHALVCVVVFSFTPYVSYATSEVQRGDNMIDEGQKVEKTKWTLLPHVEYEYGVWDYSTDVYSGQNNSGIAAGLSIGKEKNIFDIYTRLSLNSNSEGAEVKNFGLLYARKVRSELFTYFSIALEKQILEERDNYRYWESDMFRVKAALGWSHKRNRLSNVTGLGLFWGTGDVDSSYGEDAMTTMGLFVQNKAAYAISDKLSLTGSLVVELEGSIDDPDLNRETNFYSGFCIYFRLGLQYLI